MRGAPAAISSTRASRSKRTTQTWSPRRCPSLAWCSSRRRDRTGASRSIPTCRPTWDPARTRLSGKSAARAGEACRSQDQRTGGQKGRRRFGEGAEAARSRAPARGGRSGKGARTAREGDGESAGHARQGRSRASGESERDRGRARGRRRTRAGRGRALGAAEGEAGGRAAEGRAIEERWHQSSASADAPSGVIS